jgi:hypothetical protein
VIGPRRSPLQRLVSQTYASVQEHGLWWCRRLQVASEDCRLASPFSSLSRTRQTYGSVRDESAGGHFEEVSSLILASPPQPIGDPQYWAAEISRTLQFSLLYHIDTNKHKQTHVSKRKPKQIPKISNATLTSNRDGDLVKPLSYGLLPLGSFLISIR